MSNVAATYGGVHPYQPHQHQQPLHDDPFHSISMAGAGGATSRPADLEYQAYALISGGGGGSSGSDHDYDGFEDGGGMALPREGRVGTKRGSRGRKGRRRGGAAGQDEIPATLLVEDPATGTIYDVPPEAVDNHTAIRRNHAQLPAHERFPVLRLCGEHGRPGGCGLAAACGMAHVTVPLAQLAPTRAHVHFGWRSASAVTYPLLSVSEEAEQGVPAGGLAAVRLAVNGPNNFGPQQTVSAGLLLRTRGALETLRQVSRGRASHTSHCAHYYYNCVCVRGEDCAFAHMVSVTPHPPPPGTDRMMVPLYHHSVSGRRRVAQLTSDAAPPPTYTGGVLVSAGSVGGGGQPGGVEGRQQQRRGHPLQPPLGSWTAGSGAPHAVHSPPPPLSFAQASMPAHHHHHQQQQSQQHSHGAAGPPLTFPFPAEHAANGGTGAVGRSHPMPCTVGGMPVVVGGGAFGPAGVPYWTGGLPQPQLHHHNHNLHNLHHSHHPHHPHHLNGPPRFQPVGQPPHPQSMMTAAPSAPAPRLEFPVVGDIHHHHHQYHQNHHHHYSPQPQPLSGHHNGRAATGVMPSVPMVAFVPGGGGGGRGGGGGGGDGGGSGGERPLSSAPPIQPQPQPEPLTVPRTLTSQHASSPSPSPASSPSPSTPLVAVGGVRLPMVPVGAAAGAGVGSTLGGGNHRLPTTASVAQDTSTIAPATQPPTVAQPIPAKHTGPVPPSPTKTTAATASKERDRSSIGVGEGEVIAAVAAAVAPAIHVDPRREVVEAEPEGEAEVGSPHDDRPHSTGDGSDFVGWEADGEADQEEQDEQDEQGEEALTLLPTRSPVAAAATNDDPYHFLGELGYNVTSSARRRGRPGRSAITGAAAMAALMAPADDDDKSDVGTDDEVLAGMAVRRPTPVHVMTRRYSVNDMSVCSTAALERSASVIGLGEELRTTGDKDKGCGASSVGVVGGARGGGGIAPFHPDAYRGAFFGDAAVEADDDDELPDGGLSWGDLPPPPRRPSASGLDMLDGAQSGATVAEPDSLRGLAGDRDETTTTVTTTGLGGANSEACHPPGSTTTGGSIAGQFVPSSVGGFPPHSAGFCSGGSFSGSPSLAAPTPVRGALGAVVTSSAVSRDGSRSAVATTTTSSGPTKAATATTQTNANTNTHANTIHSGVIELLGLVGGGGGGGSAPGASGPPTDCCMSIASDNDGGGDAATTATTATTATAVGGGLPPPAASASVTSTWGWSTVTAAIRPAETPPQHHPQQHQQHPPFPLPTLPTLHHAQHQPTAPLMPRPLPTTTITATPTVTAARCAYATPASYANAQLSAGHPPPHHHHHSLSVTRPNHSTGVGAGFPTYPPIPTPTPAAMPYHPQQHQQYQHQYQQHQQHHHHHMPGVPPPPFTAPFPTFYADTPNTNINAMPMHSSAASHTRYAAQGHTGSSDPSSVGGSSGGGGGGPGPVYPPPLAFNVHQHQPMYQPMPMQLQGGVGGFGTMQHVSAGAAAAPHPTFDHHSRHY